MSKVIKFHSGCAPYEAGDIAGFPATVAQSFVDRGVAVFHDLKPREPDAFDGMDRAALVAYAHEHLGLTEDPPAEVSDADLRDALRAASVEPPEADKPGKAAKPKA